MSCALLEMRSIGSVTTWLSGGTPDRSRSDYWHGTIPWITASTLKSSEIWQSDQMLTETGVVAGSKMAPLGSTLLLVRGSALHNEIRAGCVVAPVAFNQDVKALVPKAGIDPKYLTFAIQGSSERLLRLVTSAGNTAGVLDTKVVQGLEVFIPPLEEQKLAVGVLNDVDTLILSLERLVAKKQAIKQGMMQELLTGRTRLPGFNESWVEATLGSVANVNMGQSPSGTSYNTSGHGMPLIQGNADIDDRRTIDRVWTTQPTKRCRVGDVVLTVRAPVGYTALAARDSCLGRGVCSVSAGKDNAFLYHALVFAEPSWAVHEQGSTFTSVNSSQVRQFAVKWPTHQEERIAIARVLGDADREIEVLQDRFAKARAIKQGMMQELLTGRTRLVPQEVSA